jgi:hypothetical protein
MKLGPQKYNSYVIKIPILAIANIKDLLYLHACGGNTKKQRDSVPLSKKIVSYKMKDMAVIKIF